ncbi:hypothetical protein BXZ70DRAFT_953622 [Cristinia sonorae]|uniref:Uncharacterized protein n=1 Tax=Cristinia sonorae TaxID=1940300 RepID=A0A8K0UGZ9_9AGAR|nr:hypothetical protein BXZ70DRAFT_953622 [Cristinia sonorae]
MSGSFPLNHGDNSIRYGSGWDGNSGHSLVNSGTYALHIANMHFLNVSLNTLAFKGLSVCGSSTTGQMNAVSVTFSVNVGQQIALTLGSDGCFTNDGLSVAMDEATVLDVNIHINRSGVGFNLDRVEIHTDAAPPGSSPDPPTKPSPPSSASPPAPLTTPPEPSVLSPTTSTPPTTTAGDAYYGVASPSKTSGHDSESNGSETHPGGVDRTPGGQALHLSSPTNSHHNATSNFLATQTSGGHGGPGSPNAPTDTSSSISSHSHSAPTGAIIGGLLGLLALLLILIVLLWRKWRKKRTPVAPSTEYLRSLSDKRKFESNPDGMDTTFVDSISEKSYQDTSDSYRLSNVSTLCHWTSDDASPPPSLFQLPNTPRAEARDAQTVIRQQELLNVLNTTKFYVDPPGLHSSTPSSSSRSYSHDSTVDETNMSPPSSVHGPTDFVVC